MGSAASSTAAVSTQNEPNSVTAVVSPKQFLQLDVTKQNHLQAHESQTTLTGVEVFKEALSVGEGTDVKSHSPHRSPKRRLDTAAGSPKRLQQRQAVCISCRTREYSNFQKSISGLL